MGESTGNPLDWDSPNFAGIEIMHIIEMIFLEHFLSIRTLDLANKYDEDCFQPCFLLLTCRASLDRGDLREKLDLRAKG